MSMTYAAIEPKPYKELVTVSPKFLRTAKYKAAEDGIESLTTVGNNLLLL